MMDASRISSKKYMKEITNPPLKKKKSGMSTDSLMIWLLTVLNLMVDLFGHARTMMEMFNQISLPKVMGH